MAKVQKITPFLWFDHQAEEAANFYTSIFPDSKINSIARNGDSVMVVSFTLDGVTFNALNGGPINRFTDAVSFVVHCKDQQEVDYYWEKLASEGGAENVCGWLHDKYGLAWQIVPDALFEMLSDPTRAQRTMASVMQMKKIVIADLGKVAEKPEPVNIKTIVSLPVEKVWKYWSEPEHITRWNQASDDWHCPKAANDLRRGGSFSATMAAKDGSFSFDFGGVYDEVVLHKLIAYTMGDGRQVCVTFESKGDQTVITEVFDPEMQNPREMQQNGWQAILDNFKKYAETAG